MVVSLEKKASTPGAFIREGSQETPEGPFYHNMIDVWAADHYFIFILIHQQSK